MTLQRSSAAFLEIAVLGSKHHFTGPYIRADRQHALVFIAWEIEMETVLCSQDNQASRLAFCFTGLTVCHEFPVSRQDLLVTFKVVLGEVDAVEVAQIHLDKDGLSNNIHELQELNL